MVSTAPSTGPMQGVQPAPKAKPTATVPTYPAGLFPRWTRFSRNRGVSLKAPIRWSPRMMMMIPPMRAIQSL